MVFVIHFPYRPQLIDILAMHFTTQVIEGQTFAAIVGPRTNRRLMEWKNLAKYLFILNAISHKEHPLQTCRTLAPSFPNDTSLNCMHECPPTELSHSIVCNSESYNGIFSNWLDSRPHHLRWRPHRYVAWAFHTGHLVGHRQVSPKSDPALVFDRLRHKSASRRASPGALNFREAKANGIFLFAFPSI